MKRFPLVMTDVKPAGGRVRNPTFPYTVTPTAAQFCQLIAGKRKAIEVSSTLVRRVHQRLNMLLVGSRSRYA